MAAVAEGGSTCDVSHVDDIEDLLDVSHVAKRPERASSVLVRRSTRPDPARDEAVRERVPGTQAIYVKTYGCQHNHSDSEHMQGLLSEYGYRLALTPDDADCWVINSCTVKGPSQDHLLTDVRKAAAGGVPIVVAGCVPQADQELPALQNLSVVGVENIDRIVEVVELTLAGHEVRLLERRAPSEKPRLDLPKVRRNNLVEVIPVNVGCLGACTYCKTVHARGRLASYPLGDVLARARRAVAEGCRELWLTSEDTGAYGRDLGTDMPTMLRALLDHALPDDGVRLRVGMTNPPYILEHLPEIASVLRDPRVFSFLHVPVQSGSDRVLRRMNREYTIAEFRLVADTLLADVPGLTLATDIICGFPGESEEDHAATLALLDEYRFPVVNISQFYPRPGTPAARMDGRLKTQQVKARSREVTRAFASYRCYDGLVGTTHELVPTEMAADGESLVAHTKGYVQVLLPPGSARLGDAVRATIISADKFHVRGRVESARLDPADQEAASSPSVRGSTPPMCVSATGHAQRGPAGPFVVPSLVVAILAAAGIWAGLVRLAGRGDHTASSMVEELGSFLFARWRGRGTGEE